LKINSVKLFNFRNFNSAEYFFKPEGNIFYGENGIGKTNLLEAISYFAFGKSFRAKSDSELINFGSPFFRVEGKFELRNQSFDIIIAADKKQKKINLNQIPIKRISELYKYLKVVYFSPGDIDIINLGPSVRRRFFDLAISQFDFLYLELLRKFHKILKQRNALLKSQFSSIEKKSWDDQFIKISVKLVQRRIMYLQEFAPLLCSYYSKIVNQKEPVSLKYSHSIHFDTDDEKELLLQYQSFVRNNSEKEKIYQRTLFGPHLDDYLFMIFDKPAREFASQGQKRTLTISSRLAQANLIGKANGEYPIIMFDDILSELDKTRAENIINMLNNDHQIFIATPNKNLYRSFNLDFIKLDIML